MEAQKAVQIILDSINSGRPLSREETEEVLEGVFSLTPMTAMEFSKLAEDAAYNYQGV